VIFVLVKFLLPLPLKELKEEKEEYLITIMMESTLLQSLQEILIGALEISH